MKSEPQGSVTGGQYATLKDSRKESGSNNVVEIEAFIANEEFIK